MDMRVPHGLSAGLAAVRADVEPIGCMPGNEQFFHFKREQEAIQIFGFGQIEHGNHMPPGHDQRMPGGHREGIRESERMGALDEDLPVGSTEDAGWLVHAGLGHAGEGLVDSIDGKGADFGRVRQG